MLELKFIRENTDKIRQTIANKKANVDLDLFLSLDNDRRKKISEVEQLKANRNTVSKEIGQKKSKGEDASDILAQMQKVADTIHALDEEVKAIDEKMHTMTLYIPNVTHPSLPHGDMTQNQVIRQWGQKPHFDFKPQAHWDIGEKLGMIDLKTGAKITGSGFVLYKNAGALLERALINFMIDMHVTEHGFQEIFPPFLVNRDSMTGTGQLPKLEADMYRLEADDLFLVPTAEVPVTNIHREEILDESQLPINYVAYTPCFRREAGSYGKDTRGIIRVHQFDKVEMVKFVKPEESYDHLEALVRYAEAVLQRLNLHYQIVLLADGDLSFSASKCYDIEVWAPGQDKYLEVSSCSNFEAFQARRANIRYKKKDGKTEFVHTLNGSGIALARTVVAILENYQTKNSELIIPEALRKYMRGLEKLSPKND